MVKIYSATLSESRVGKEGKHQQTHLFGVWENLKLILRGDEILLIPKDRATGFSRAPSCECLVVATPFWFLTIFVDDWHGVAKSPRRVRHAHDKTPDAIRKVMAVNRSCAKRKTRLLFAPKPFNVSLLRYWPVKRQKSIGLTPGSLDTLWFAATNLLNAVQ